MVAILAAAGVSELLVTHNVAALADIERAAFFAARSPRRRCVTAEDWGVSDPGFSPVDFAPGR